MTTVGGTATTQGRVSRAPVWQGKVAVVAHRRKTLGGGLPELRERLTGYGARDLLWYEVEKSRQAPKRVRAAVKEGAQLLVVWGGDGMVQRCADALVNTDVELVIVPAGTANLLARNLGVPQEIDEAVRIGFEGDRRQLDLGRVNGEHFAVMAGLGLDAALIKDADGGLKNRLGPLAYVWTGLRHVNSTVVRMKVKVDGAIWFRGAASCVLVGNVGMLTGGIPAFPDASPDDGWLEVGVATAANPVQWARTLGRMGTGHADRSPFVHTTRARRVTVRLKTATSYELDGGARVATTRFKAHVVPGAVTVRVPAR